MEIDIDRLHSRPMMFGRSRRLKAVRMDGICPKRGTCASAKREIVLSKWTRNCARWAGQESRPSLICVCCKQMKNHSFLMGGKSVAYRGLDSAQGDWSVVISKCSNAGPMESIMPAIKRYRTKYDYIYYYVSSVQPIHSSTNRLDDKFIIAQP